VERQQESGSERRGTTERALPAGYALCSSNPPACNNYKKEAGKVWCLGVQACTNGGCKCRLFSFDPNKPNEAYKFEAEQDVKVDVASGRDYICRCTKKT
jgi:hypothetical protein